MRDPHDTRTPDLHPGRPGRRPKNPSGPMDAATRQAVSRAVRAERIAVAMRSPGTVDDLALLADALKRAVLDGNTRALRRLAARISEVANVG